MKTSDQVLKDLQVIPGIGRSIAQDLVDLGYTSVSSLKDADPEMMYQKLCDAHRQHLDRCLLYTFRCAVYFASHTKHDPEKLKWWNWKDAPGIQQK